MASFPYGRSGGCRDTVSYIIRLRAGSSYASAALFTKIAAKPHHSGVRKVEMMLGTFKRILEVYRIKIKLATSDFEMEAEVTTVDKPQLMTVENPRYKRLLEKHPHL